MSRIASDLGADHAAILGLVDAVELLAGAARVGRLDPPLLSRALELVERFVDGSHHAKEEAVLFPGLEPLGLRPGEEPLAMFALEHDRGRALARAMRRALERADGAGVGVVADAWCLLVRAHVAAEDRVLLPLVDAALLPAEREALRERLAEADRAALGPGGAAALLAEVEELAEAVRRWHRALQRTSGSARDALCA